MMGHGGKAIVTLSVALLSRALGVARAAALLSAVLTCGAPAQSFKIVGSRQRLTVWLGPAETVLGPDQRTDNPFHTLGRAPNLLAYVSHLDSFGFAGGRLGSLVPFDRPVLARGREGEFDGCGAWLNSTWQDGGAVRGWYHAETDCGYASTRKSVAYAESADGGRSFAKPDYPHNRVITAPARYKDPVEASEGDHHVMRVGDYLHMYFVAARDAQVRLARSRVADGGRPGTWYKYYEGKFSEPGLGGRSTPIAPDLLARSWVTYNEGLKLFIGFSYFHEGFGLAASPDGVKGWKRVTDLVVAREGKFWGRGRTSRELVEYPSLIGQNGEADGLGSDFWLYYMMLPPGRDFAQGRYLVRRRVRVEWRGSPKPFDSLPRVALSLYRREDGSDVWLTTSNPPPNYRLVETLGYLFTSSQGNSMRAIFDCYDPGTARHLTEARPDCGVGDTPTVRYLRRLGWLAPKPFPSARALYRCADREGGRRFISPGEDCGGQQLLSTLGFFEAAPDGAPPKDVRPPTHP